MPLALESLWTQRLDQTIGHIAHAVETIEVAAALGRSVSVEEWESACALVGYRVDKDILNVLEEADLIRIHQSQGRFDFGHALLVDSVLRRTKAGGRLKTCHRICSDVLKTQKPVDYRRLAYHRSESGEYGLAYSAYRSAAKRFFGTG